MKIQLAHIVQQLFGVSSLEEVNVESLENLVKEYPYFSTGHFLLARKKQHMNGIAPDDVMQKASMYFHDPLWLKWQMGETERERERERESERETGDTEREREVSHHIEEPEAHKADTPHFVEVTENGRVGEDERPEINEQQNYFSESLSGPAETNETHTAGESEDFHERLGEDEKHEFEDQYHETEDQYHETEDQNHETEDQDHETEDRDHEAEDRDHETGEQYESEEELRGPGEYRGQYLGPGDSPTHTDDKIPVADDQIQIGERSGAAVSEPAASENRPEPAAEAPLVFQAYHTIDYFASQGIKAPAEVQPNDKLGRQLRSFTEWLKTMKRLPQVETGVAPDENEQHHIRQSADGSLKKEEVVTETMAEVLAKQERKHEAIAIYEKLSLLDPSKSAYFAAKIENLKDH